MPALAAPGIVDSAVYKLHKTTVYARQAAIKWGKPVAFHPARRTGSRGRGHSMVSSRFCCFVFDCGPQGRSWRKQRIARRGSLDSRRPRDDQTQSEWAPARDANTRQHTFGTQTHRCTYNCQTQSGWQRADAGALAQMCNGRLGSARSHPAPISGATAPSSPRPGVEDGDGENSE